MRARLGDWGWVLLWGVLGSVWCVSAGRQFGPTYDEPFYLEQGLHFWHTGSVGELLRQGTMPLPIVVNTAPVRAWELLRGAPVDLTSEFHAALAVARPATLLWWWLLLLYGVLLARRTAGPWAGRIVVPLLACEPVLLANAALAATDVAIAAAMLVFLYHYQAGRSQGWWKRVGLPACLYAVALLAKASALVFCVLVMAAVESFRVWEQTDPAARWRDRLRAVCSALAARTFRTEVMQVVCLGLVLTFVACGSDWKPDRSFVALAHKLPQGRGASCVVWLSEHLCIFQNAGVAIVRQIKHNIQQHGGAYLLGTWYPRSVWWFFPVSLLIKLTPPLLLLPVCLAVLSPRSLGNRLLALTAAFVLFSFNCKVQIGVRLVSPLVVFFILGVACALADAWMRSAHSWRRPVLVALGCAALVGLTTSAASAWPNGLQYVNAFWGDSEHGFRCVGGSDFDWGQGMPELERWAGQRQLGLLYFGTDPLCQSSRYHRLDWTLPAREASATGLAAQLHGRDLAVSVSLLYGCHFGTPQLQEVLEYLRGCEPIERTSCFFIYRFPAEGPTETPPRTALVRP